MRLARGATLRLHRNFLKRVGELDERAVRRIVGHLKAIRSGSAELLQSMINPELFHFYDDDYVLHLVVSHDRTRAVATALTRQTAEDL